MKRNISRALDKAGFSRIGYPATPFFSEEAQKNARPVMPLPAVPLAADAPTEITKIAMPRSSSRAWLNSPYLPAFVFVIALAGAAFTYRAYTTGASEDIKLNTIVALPEVNKLAARFPNNINRFRTGQVSSANNQVAIVITPTRKSRRSQESAVDSTETYETPQESSVASPEPQTAQLAMIQEQVGELRRRRAPKLKKIKDQIKQVKDIFTDLEP